MVIANNDSSSSEGGCGCFIIGIIVLVLVGWVHETITNLPEKNSVVLSDKQVAKFSAAKSEAATTRDRYIGILLDKNSTVLARETFSNSVEGRNVTWLVKVHSISQTSSNIIEGRFSIPYVFTDNEPKTLGILSVLANFPSTQTDQLLNLRVGEWVKVSGTLKILDLDRSSIELLNPTISSDS